MGYKRIRKRIEKPKKKKQNEEAFFKKNKEPEPYYDPYEVYRQVQEIPKQDQFDPYANTRVLNLFENNFVKSLTGNNFVKSIFGTSASSAQAVQVSKTGDAAEKEADREAKNAVQADKDKQNQPFNLQESVERYKKMYGIEDNNLRLYTDEEAQQLLEKINAKAATHGTDIYFGTKQPDPETVAHEVYHVKQQQTAGVSVQRKENDTKKLPLACDPEWKRLPQEFFKHYNFYDYLFTQYKDTSFNMYNIQAADKVWLKLAKLNNMKTDEFRKHVENRDKDLILSLKTVTKFNPDKIEMTKVRQPDGSFKVTEYDSMGNVKKEYIEKAETPAENKQKTDNKKKEDSKQSNADKVAVRKVLQPDGRYHVTEYDSSGKITKEYFESQNARFVNIDGAKILQGMNYLSQLDNTTRDNLVIPARMCNLTSLAMVLQFMGIKQKYPKMKFPDELYKVAKSKGIKGPEIWERPYQIYKLLLTEYTSNKLGFINPSTGNLKNEIKSLINSGKPVILSSYFDSRAHIAVVIGYDNKGWIMHDPFGNATTHYVNENGVYVHYPYADIDIKHPKSWITYFK